MPLELSEMTLEEVLHSYSSIKGHRTRCEREIGNLLELLTAQYSSTSEDRINDRLEKLEKRTHKLINIAPYLVSIKYAKAWDHQEEVNKFLKLSTNVLQTFLLSCIIDILLLALLPIPCNRLFSAHLPNLLFQNLCLTNLATTLPLLFSVLSKPTMTRLSLIPSPVRSSRNILTIV